MANNSTGIVGNPYAGGNVVLNTTPFTTFYTNMLARRQAQSDAFAKQMQEQGRSLTPAGMRSQDVGALMQAKNDWQSHWQQNKDLIQHPDRDNGKAWGENNDLYNKALGLIGQSKNEAKIDALSTKLKLDPNRAGRVSKVGRDLLDKQALPINDPNHVSLSEADFDSNLFNPKPLSLEQDEKLQKFLPSQFAGEEDVSQRKLGDLNPDYTRNVTVVHKPTAKDLKGIAAMGEQLYHSGELAGEVDKIVNEHGKNGNGLNNPTYDYYNNIIKQNYGHDIDIEHPEELATAMLIDKNGAYKPHEGKPIVDWEAKKAAEQAAQRNQAQFTSNLTFGRESELDKLKRQRNEQEAIEGNKNVLIDAGRAADKNPIAITTTKGKETWGVLPLEKNQIDQLVTNAATTKLNSLGQKYVTTTKVPYDDVVKAPNGQFFGVRYKRNTDGSVDKSGTDKLDKLDHNQLAGLMVKGETTPKFKAQVTNAAVKAYEDYHAPENINYDIKGETYSHKDLLDKGYTEEQIKSAISAGNIKPKAADGLTTKAAVKSNPTWSISQDLVGQDSHADGGVDVNANGQTVNAEGGELKIKSDDGKEAIIPKRWRQRIMNLFKKGDNKTITTIVNTLPKQLDTAADGGVYPPPTKLDTAADGGVYPPPTKLDPQIKEKIDYVQSPTYKKRLEGMSVENPDKLIQDRIDYLKKAQFYTSENKDVQASTSDVNGVPQVVLAKGDSSVTKAHEIGHITAGGNQEKVYSPFKATMSQMSPNEAWAFINRNKAITPEMKNTLWQKYHDESFGKPVTAGQWRPPHEYSMDLPADVYGKTSDVHEISTSENKADLDALRFLLHKEGVTKEYGEDLTPELLEKAAKHKGIKNEPHFQRMIANFGKEGIIKLNNIIASSDKNKDNNQA